MRGWVAPVLMILGVGLMIMAFIRRSNAQKAKAVLAADKATGAA
jgi:cytochrome c-type biogenesis protein CcmH/NrfF